MAQHSYAPNVKLSCRAAWRCTHTFRISAGRLNTTLRGQLQHHVSQACFQDHTQCRIGESKISQGVRDLSSIRLLHSAAWRTERSYPTNPATCSHAHTTYLGKPLAKPPCVACYSLQLSFILRSRSFFFSLQSGQVP